MVANLDVALYDQGHGGRGKGDKKMYYWRN